MLLEITGTSGSTMYVNPDRVSAICPAEGKEGAFIVSVGVEDLEVPTSEVGKIVCAADGNKDDGAWMNTLMALMPLIAGRR